MVYVNVHVSWGEATVEARVHVNCSVVVVVWSVLVLCVGVFFPLARVFFVAAISMLLAFLVLLHVACSTRFHRLASRHGWY